MLKLKNICKSYKYAKQNKIILDNINLDFKKNEIVFILGKSGSGKSTLLNIISGFIKSNNGNIYLDDIDITKLSNKKMDSYRNSTIGYIFQDYNLIDYMNVYDNIMLSCTKKNNSNYLDELLKKLEIYDKKYTLVKNLSGGEKQRVAIARGLINNPDIILADEPTGALDSFNSIKIIEILKEISKEKLVIVVTHDLELANKYADRIINIIDGKVVYEKQEDNKKFNKIRKSKIKKIKILKIALKNLLLKKWRTIITSLAITLGLSSILIVTNLSTNFNKEISNLEKDIVSIFPININNSEYEKDINITKDNTKIILKKENKTKNNITKEYIDYLNNIKEINYITYNYDINMPIISDKYNYVDNFDLKIIPSNKYILNNYNLIYGKLSTSPNEILLVIDSNNNVDERILKYFNISTDIDYISIINRKIKIIPNDNYFINIGDYFIINENKEDMYNKSNLELTIVGIIQEKEITNDSSFIYYSNDIITNLLNVNKDSQIVKKQLSINYNILGNNTKKEELLSFLGYNTIPNNINIYFNNIDNKTKTISLLDKYNKTNYIKYTDTMKETIDIVKNFIDIISIILISFSIISILISLIMISILTNIRVLERKKEIGILRSIGFSKKNITTLFNIENIIIGLISSFFSILLLNILKNPINKILYNLIDLDNIMNIDYKITIIILILNIIIIKISGFIPSKRAGKLEITNCIYDR